MRHDTQWTLVFLNTGLTILFADQEDCRSAAFYYGDNGVPVSIRAPLYY